MANRTLALVKALYNGALEDGFATIEWNPATLLEPRGEEVPRNRFLNRSEIKTVWKVVAEELPPRPAGQADGSGDLWNCEETLHRRGPLYGHATAAHRSSVRQLATRP